MSEEARPGRWTSASAKARRRQARGDRARSRPRGGRHGGRRSVDVTRGPGSDRPRVGPCARAASLLARAAACSAPGHRSPCFSRRLPPTPPAARRRGDRRLGCSLGAWSRSRIAPAAARAPARPRRARPRLAGLTAWTALSLAWAPLGEPAGEDVQRLLLYLADAGGRDRAAARARRRAAGRAAAAGRDHGRDARTGCRSGCCPGLVDLARRARAPATGSPSRSPTGTRPARSPRSG